MLIKFSIITPTYNRAGTGFLEEVIKTVRSQKRGAFEYEHIIIDDGSTDDTASVLKSFLNKDNHIKYIYQKNSGTPQAIKNGIKHATGNYVVVLGDDDLLPKDSLYQREKFIIENPKIDFFYGKTQWIDDLGKPIKTWTQSLPLPEHPYERMLAENFIQGGTITVKKTVYNKVSWPEWLKKSDDYFFAMEIFRPENNFKYKYLDQVLYKYRRHNRGAGMQSGRSLINSKAAEERWELDNKIRYLHPTGLAYLSSELNKAWRENRVLEAKARDLESALNYYKNSADAKDELIQKILNSKSWKLLEFVRKVLRIR